MMIRQISTDKFICDKPNLVIITFDKIFESVVIHVINLVFSIYGDLDIIKKLNGDVKKIIIHSLLEQIYLRMLRENDVNVILYLNTSITTNLSEIWSYIEPERLEPFITKICKQISTRAPLPIHVEPSNIDLLTDCGETREIINKLDNTLCKFKREATSLNKLKKYSKANGLVQFMDKYHPEDLKKGMFYDKYLKGVSYEQI